MRRGLPLHRNRALFEKLSDEGPLMPFPRGVARASPPLSLSRPGLRRRSERRQLTRAPKQHAARHLERLF
jgi:hypothetical protein